MKRILLVLLLLPTMVGANDLRVTLTDSITSADTNTVRVDTVVTPAMDVRSMDLMSFYSQVTTQGWYHDTTWTNDTFFVELQHSHDGITWATLAEIDTFLTSGASWSSLLLNRADSVVGNYARGLMIHRDSIGAGEADAALVDSAAAFRKDFILWICGN